MYFSMQVKVQDLDTLFLVILNLFIAGTHDFMHNYMHTPLLHVHPSDMTTGQQCLNYLTRKSDPSDLVLRP